MRAKPMLWSPRTGWTLNSAEPVETSLVLYFGAHETLAHGAHYDEMRGMFPSAHILGCSTGGQIYGDNISDDEIVAAAIAFDATRLKLRRHEIGDPSQSRECGEAIGRALAAEDLAGVFVLSDGLNVNGTALVAGIAGAIGAKIPVTGGLAGDGPYFRETLVGGDCAPRTRTVAAIGFYGSAIRVSHGSAGGWDPFGPRRRVTKSAGNVLFELDDKPALDLYERYLGPEESEGLPGAALLFPMRIHDAADPDSAVVRTVLAVDRDARSMTFAGDVPQGWVAQLMHGNFDRLAAGAAEAARQARAGLDGGVGAPQLSVLVSCIGRRLLMGQQTVAETEAAGAELGADTMRLGFYSYGEICPHAKSGLSGLHNQTMTITSFAEIGG